MCIYKKKICLKPHKKIQKIRRVLYIVITCLSVYTTLYDNKTTKKRTMESLQDRVISAYLTPGHPIAFSAPKTVAEYFHISEKKAKNILEHCDSYNVHREYKKPRVYNPFYVHSRREQIQTDLIDVSRLSASNKGVRFLLLLIDIFTKRMWVCPLRNKSAKVVEKALRVWLESLDVSPKQLGSDRGLEYNNNLVQTLLRRHGVEWLPLGGTMKAAVAERANKSLQVLIYKYLSSKETVKYINQLQSLVETYNNRSHRSLDGMTPMEADRVENESKVQGIHHARYEKIARHRRDRLPYKVGEIVRIKTLSNKVSSSNRAYAEQFKGEYFRIVRINRTLPVAMYYLRSLDTDEFIDGGFYAQELQRQRGDVYKIEKVLGRRVRRGVAEIKVKWQNFGPRWNEWIPESNVTEMYRR